MFMTKALKTLFCTVIMRVWLCLELVFWGFLSSPDDLLRSPYEVGGRGVERLRKLRDLVDLDVAFCGEYAHESAYGDTGRFG
jgi:hypothetical protein